MNLILLENKLELHAENNIQYQQKAIPGAYIGVSRLSCIDCDHLLWNSLLAHRGTHGIYFEICSQGIWKNEIKINHQHLFKISNAEDITLKANLLKQFAHRKAIFEHKNAILVGKGKKALDSESLKLATEELDKRFSLDQQADLSDDEEIEKGMGLFEGGMSLLSKIKLMLQIKPFKNKEERKDFDEEDTEETNVPITTSTEVASSTNLPSSASNSVLSMPGNILDLFPPEREQCYSDIEVRVVDDEITVILWC